MFTYFNIIQWWKYLHSGFSVVVSLERTSLHIISALMDQIQLFRWDFKGCFLYFIILWINNSAVYVYVTQDVVIRETVAQYFTSRSSSMKPGLHEFAARICFLPENERELKETVT